MDRRQVLLTELLNRPDMRKFFPSLSAGGEETADTEIFRILERLWPIVRETSGSDEECVENIDLLTRIAVSLGESGRLQALEQ